jgi:fused signal recognition particle receptor
VSSCILAKYDSTAKGGIALAISHQLGIPFSFLGTGEQYGDLEPFDTDRYLDGLVGLG